jgi:hypothetical protein
MGFEDNLEKGTTKTHSPAQVKMTLEKAIEMGEYDPEYLGTFPEWHDLSRHIQFEYIRKALDNRNRQLVLHWAEINNILDYSTKPELKIAQENIQNQIKKVDKDRERLYLEYSV